MMNSIRQHIKDEPEQQVSLSYQVSHYEPELENDACGTGVIAKFNGKIEFGV